ncbi:MAG: NUDIX pyrophosphatase, partial [Spirochaetota bacterium]|nr:NUDIX pyrophosphatase [Spirochaetota bacterium]
SEETGLQKADLTMQYAGDPIDIPDSQKDGVYWRVYPFLFIVTSPEKVVLDWEHDEMRWVDPSEVKNYDTVPDLCRVMKSVMSDL